MSIFSFFALSAARESDWLEEHSYTGYKLTVDDNIRTAVLYATSPAVSD